jgi:hypothetical protein
MEARVAALHVGRTAVPVGLDGMDEYLAVLAARMLSLSSFAEMTTGTRQFPRLFVLCG